MDGAEGREQPTADDSSCQESSCRGLSGGRAARRRTAAGEGPRLHEQPDDVVDAEAAHLAPEEVLAPRAGARAALARLGRTDGRGMPEGGLGEQGAARRI